MNTWRQKYPLTYEFLTTKFKDITIIDIFEKYGMKNKYQEMYDKSIKTNDMYLDKYKIYISSMTKGFNYQFQRNKLQYYFSNVNCIKRNNKISLQEKSFQIDKISNYIKNRLTNNYYNVEYGDYLWRRSCDI